MQIKTGIKFICYVFILTVIIITQFIIDCCASKIERPISFPPKILGDSPISNRHFSSLPFLH